MSGPPRIDRRTALRLLGATSVTAVAGCNARSDRSTPTDAGGDSAESSTTTPTASPSTATTSETATTARSPEIRVESGRLRDARLTPRLVGFRPETDVTLVASTRDGLGRTWQSSATVRTDESGAVSLADQAPTDGTYEGTRPMGFVWSMEMDSLTEPSFFVPDPPEHSVTLSTHVDGTERATTDVVRQFVDPDVTRRAVRERGLVGHYYEPPGEGPHASVVALHGAGNRPLRNYGRMLASYDVATLAVKWFGEEDPLPDELARVPVEYVRTAVEWLQSRERVRGDETGLIGHSKGAEYALLAASRFDGVGPVVAIAPSAYVWQSPTQGISESSWTVDGEPHPTVPRPERPQPPEGVRGRSKTVGTLRHAIERASDAALADARIPVEDIGGDVLLVAGGRDGVWPSVQMAETVADRLGRADVDSSHETLTYPAAGHVITIRYRPTTYEMVGGGLYLGGDPGTIAAAEADAWPRTASWFWNALDVEASSG